MKKSLWCGALALLLCVPAWGQGLDSDFDFDTDGYGGGGPTVGWLSLDLGGLNDSLTAHGYAPLPAEMFVFGGGGNGGGYLSMRFGGRGGNGRTTSNNGGKVAELALNYGGFSMDYAAFGNDRYDMTIGALIGGGSATLTLYANRPNTFEDAVANPSSSLMTRDFFLIQPSASLGLRVMPWLGLRVYGGYLFTIPGAWKQGGLELPGPPANFNSWTVEVLIEFGGHAADLEEGTHSPPPEEGN